MSKHGVISGPYFPVFRLNTQIYGINLCIQSEYRKIWTRNNSLLRHFSRSEDLSKKTNSSKCFSFVNKKIRIMKRGCRNNTVRYRNIYVCFTTSKAPVDTRRCFNVDILFNFAWFLYLAPLAFSGIAVLEKRKRRGNVKTVNA